MSSLISNLGNLHIFTAVTNSGGTSITSNDATATIATGGDGLFTITFGEAWLAAPVVGLTGLDPSYDGNSEGILNASITSITTTALVVQTAYGGDAALDGVAQDAIVHIVAIGKRNI